MPETAASFVYALWNQTIDRILMSRATERRQRDDDSNDDDSVSCASTPPEQTTDRTEFRSLGGTIYGYPSTGGVLIKAADPVDMIFLSLSCLGANDRAQDTETEDRFCRRMLQVGAKWWPSKRSWLLSGRSDYNLTEEQSKIMVFGWPPDEQGVWFLRYDNETQLPADFGRISLVTSMDAKIEVMKSFNAIFVNDASRIEELDLAHLPRVPDLTLVSLRDLKPSQLPLFTA